MKQTEKNSTKRILAVTLIAASITLGALVSCQGQGPKQTGGSLIGAAAGGLVGSQFGSGSGQLVGVALGTLLGYQIGGAIGRQMDQQDRMMASRAAYSALEKAPDHKAVAWKNPNNNHSGSVKVTNTYEDRGKNMVCRDYVHTVIIDGEQEKVYGRACRDLRDPKAQWMVQK